MKQRFDPRILQLIPHRPPMLLINKLLHVDNNSASAEVMIDAQTPFLDSTPNQIAGVPAWLGIEYMGQTAALIAGFQEQSGMCEPHLGFLMGARKFQTKEPRFKLGTSLVVSCQEAALVGESLAMFTCTISSQFSELELASASLTVYRRPLEEQKHQ